MNSFKNFLGLVLIVFLIVPLSIRGEEKYEYRIIKDPNPTMEETHYTELVKVAEIADEVAKNKFIFYPLDLTADSTGALYIYDRYQSAVIKLDKNLKYITSIGRYGFGPGEFTAKGMGPMVYIDASMGNKLYVNDMNGFRVSVFELDGTFVRQVKYKAHNFLKPSVDKQGNIIFYNWQDRKLKFQNEKSKVLFELPYGSESNEISFLFHKQIDEPRRRMLRKHLNNWFPLSYGDITILNLTDSTFLFYLSPSATAYLIQGGKLIRRINIWPRQALLGLKNRINGNLKKSRYNSAKMFYRIIPDGDKVGILYFQFGIEEGKNRNLLYKINLKGELMDVLYVMQKKGAPFVNFRVKKNGLFYARYDEKIALYKEVAK